MSARGTRPGPPHDERDAFFRDLRALRERHGLDLREIAERTRFPADALAAAETGPELPELPTLSAYLRGCGEPLTSWEDRWRRLAASLTRAASPPAQRAPSAGLAPAHRKHPHAPGAGCSKACLEVAGVGCPHDQDDGVVLGDSPTGPGWAAAGGGWAGNGCDGSAVWTMNPNGNQPTSSALTWEFSPDRGASQCTLAVFVPTQNALGTGDYAILTGNPAEPRNIAMIPVSQAVSAGQWITLGRYPVSGTSVEIQVAPAADTAGMPGPGAHGRNHVADVAPGYHAAIAASAASVRCS